MATSRNPRTIIAQPYQQRVRRPRNPQHRFNVRTLPWSIQPIAIAPVLPGETLTNVHIQSQVWSEPLHARLKNTGWWIEVVAYYVKLRDLGANATERAAIAESLVTGVNPISTTLNPGAGSAALFEAATAIGGAAYLSRALTRIVEEYWRYEGEDASEAIIGGVPAASYVPADHR